MANYVRRSDDQGVAILAIDNPPANAFSDGVLTELFKAIEACHADPDVEAIVVTGTKGKFSAGIDIMMLGSDLDIAGGRAAAVTNLSQQLEEGPKPTVAAIEGVCLGAGLELALACSARVAVRTAVLGLPEVRLGLLPGMGGTQRLPRLADLDEALRLIATGATVTAPKAQELGFVDVICDGLDELLASAGRRARDMAQGSIPRPPPTLTREDRLPDREALAQAVGLAQLQLQRDWMNARSSLLALDAVETGLLEGPQAGMDKEGAYFDRALQTPVHKALASAFFAHRAMKKARNPAQWLVRWLYALWTRVVALAALAWEWWRPVPSSEPVRKTD
ncbi:hypothetical protein QBZ16_002834 [Prototheca wickerhamii]|uniref:3-hydroxyacyl-CoA dehydrogenase n=1 Tax=Prototheca wickerhamii TaxID=3111 RepID=A0AAD9MM50_PROWI|nr:hypothetical protein QBZ16_002834 [Prototheca wickerhamii]